MRMIRDGIGAMREQVLELAASSSLCEADPTAHPFQRAELRVRLAASRDALHSLEYLVEQATKGSSDRAPGRSLFAYAGRFALESLAQVAVLWVLRRAMSHAELHSYDCSERPSAGVRH